MKKSAILLFVFLIITSLIFTKNNDVNALGQACDSSQGKLCPSGEICSFSEKVCIENPTGTGVNNAPRGKLELEGLKTSETFPIKCSGNGIETALGCISTESPTSLVVFLLRLALGIGGGIAFLLMLFGVFQIITSAGSPDRLKAGQELITSALIGLMMIIFSIFLLQLIGVQILGLNAFGFES